jgi:hypothetical protein
MTFFLGSIVDSRNACDEARSNGNPQKRFLPFSAFLVELLLFHSKLLFD